MVEPIDEEELLEETEDESELNQTKIKNKSKHDLHLCFRKNKRNDGAQDPQE
jgi:hypothetical protein